MRRTMIVLVVTAILAALSAGVAMAESDPAIRGTNAGDALYGTSYADLIYGFGGADLIYGYSGRDVLNGGNERGWGDKILGGSWGDKIRGQGGDDALYGQRGHDKIYGGAGHDLIVGGPGRDFLNGGPGFDQVNAQDGWRDVIVICGNRYDEIYYDRGLDVLRGCRTQSSADSSTSSEVTNVSGSTASKANLISKKASEDLFAHTGKVLVKHEGSERCVPEKSLKSHADHGDDVVNPSGCSGSDQGRR